MAVNKTRGYYTFADGYFVWFYGLSASEKKALVREHGPITKFEHTD